MDKLRQEVIDDLGAAYDPDISLPVKKLLGRLEKATPTLTEMKNLRQLTREWYDPTDRKSITNRLLLKIRDRVDTFIENAGKADLISRDSKAAAAALKNLTPDEKALADDIARGSLSRNLTTYAGRAFAPQAGAFGAASSTAAVVSGVLSGYPSAAAAPVIGAGAKMLSDRITKRKAQRLAELMRAGGTREALLGPDNAAQRLAKSERERLARALLSGQLSLVPYASEQD